MVVSCEESIVSDKNDAYVRQIDGIYVYIYSKPKKDHQVLGSVVNPLAEQLNEATKGKKKFGDIVSGILSTGAKNADFQKLLYSMVAQAKKDYREAEGIIFDKKLSEGLAIKFTE
ncbi:hypothetical protein SAMN04488029_2302 [Reichenbachiella faecimaris]|uniref:Uncharacterized protein n=2 Tax=Reichenbachiella faecimaris TaxID=692418 RepID=A0A1W2GEV9_REIFA|nr:hypothetical protein SAMN04488029_2302 [Reichenbachiella faecimaris]